MLALCRTRRSRPAGTPRGGADDVRGGVVHAREDRVVVGAEPEPASLGPAGAARRARRPRSAAGRGRWRSGRRWRAGPDDAQPFGPPVTPSSSASRIVRSTRIGASGWSGPKSYSVRRRVEDHRRRTRSTPCADARDAHAGRALRLAGMTQLDAPRIGRLSAFSLLALRQDRAILAIRSRLGDAEGPPQLWQRHGRYRLDTRRTRSAAGSTAGPGHLRSAARNGREGIYSIGDALRRRAHTGWDGADAGHARSSACYAPTG